MSTTRTAAQTLAARFWAEPAVQQAHGAFRKLKVELVNPATNEPLPVKDEKGKPIKYQIVTKTGYKAPRVVCAQCGEGVNFHREVQHEGRTLCRACAGDRYYGPA